MKGKTDKLSKSKLHAFHADNSQPSRQFEKRLREEFLSFADDSTLSPSFKLISIINMLRFKQIAPKLMAITALVAILGGVTLPTAIHRYQVRQARSNLDTLLSKALQNNSTRALAYEQQSSKLPVNLDNLTFSPELMDMDTSSPSFIRIKIAQEQGPAFDRCAMLSAVETNGTETVTMFTDDENEVFANKTIFTDNTGKLRQYSLFLSTGDHTDTYDYYGGKYAVHIYSDLTQDFFSDDDGTSETDTQTTDADRTSEAKQTVSTDTDVESDKSAYIAYGEQTDDMPSVAQTDPTGEKTQAKSPSFRDVFGDDATLEDIVKIDGRKYYVIQWAEKMPCSVERPTLFIDNTDANDDSAWQDRSDTITTRGYFDTETMVLKREEMYYKDASENNLILRTYYDETAKSDDLTWDAVKSDFTFDLDVPVKDIKMDISEDYQNPPSEDQDSIIRELTSHEYNLLIPEDESLTFTDIMMPSLDLQDMDISPDLPDFMQYLQDRDFYSDDEYGEKMYEQMHITELSAPSDDMPSAGSMMPDNIPVPDVVLMYTSSKTGDPDDGDLYEISLGHGLADTDITQYVYGIDGDPTEDTLIVDGRKIVSQHYMLNTDFTGEKPGDIYTFETKDGDSYTVFVSHQNPGVKLPTFRTVVSNDLANRDFIEDLVNATTGRK